MELLLNIHNHVYDPSFLLQYCECKRKCYYKYVLGLKPKAISAAPNFGGLIHEVLAEHYRGKPDDECLALWNNIAADLPDDNLRTSAKGEEILRNYFETHQDEPFTNDPTLVESRFSLDMDGFTLNGRLDLPIQWGEQAYVLDHKTTKMISEAYFHGFETSLQMKCYALATRALLGRCDGCVINAIRVSPKTPEQISKAKMTTFQRHIISVNEKQMEETIHQVGLIVADFEARYSRLADSNWNVWNSKHSRFDLGKDLFYKESPACSYFGGCEYRWLCQHGEDDKVIDAHFTRAEEPGVRYDEEEVKK